MSVAANVIVSVPAVVVIVTFDPAARVKVSVELSATTSLCPLTDIVLNESVCVSVAAIVKLGYVPLTVIFEPAQ